MRTPRFMQSVAGSLIWVEHTDVTLPKCVLDARGLLAGLRPAHSHADGEEHGHVRRGQDRTRQHFAKPVSDGAPEPRGGLCLTALDAPPNPLLKPWRERPIGAPQLQQFAKRF